MQAAVPGLRIRAHRAPPARWNSLVAAAAQPTDPATFLPRAPSKPRTSEGGGAGRGRLAGPARARRPAGLRRPRPGHLWRKRPPLRPLCPSAARSPAARPARTQPPGPSPSPFNWLQPAAVAATEGPRREGRGRPRAAGSPRSYLTTPVSSVASSTAAAAAVAAAATFLGSAPAAAASSTRSARLSRPARSPRPRRHTRPESPSPAARTARSPARPSAGSGSPDPPPFPRARRRAGLSNGGHSGSSR